jgi:hypothetical protein
MKPVASFVFTVAALSLSGLAHAAPDIYSASIELTGFPSLSPTSSIGYWVGEAKSTTYAQAVHLEGFIKTPADDYNRVWGASSNSSSTGSANFGSPGVGLPQTAVAVTGFNQVSSKATIDSAKVSSAIEFGVSQGHGGSGMAESKWAREFVLKPNATMTFSAVGKIDIPSNVNGDPRFFVSEYVFGHDNTIGFSRYATNSRGPAPTGGLFESEAELGVNFLGDYSRDMSGIVDYTLDRQTGQLSFTIFNKFDTDLSGVLQAGTSFSAWQQALPVPEPHTYASLLLGLGVMGAVARRKRQAAKAAQLG